MYQVLGCCLKSLELVLDDWFNETLKQPISSMTSLKGDTYLERKHVVIANIKLSLSNQNATDYFRD